MDAKAGFMSAFSAALLAFIWTSAKLPTSETRSASVVAAIASLSAFVSLGCALWAVIPRVQLATIFGRRFTYANAYKPLSFYSYVASNYPKGQDLALINDACALTIEDLIKEALEQHFTISHVVHRKSIWVARAGTCLISSVILTIIAVALDRL